MSAGESIILFSNAGAGTSAAKPLLGGKYQVIYVGTGAGAADLYKVGPDGSTGVKVATQIVATTGLQVLDLPPGSYYGIVSGFTASYLAVTRIPGD